MPHDVFISFASEDKVIADAMCACLEQGGIRCWIAPRDIPEGADWPSAIMDALSSSRAYVVILSSHSKNSEHVAREAHQASIEIGIPVIPFRVEDVQPEGGLAYILTGKHWLDALTPPLERHLEQLAQGVGGLLKEPYSIPPKPPVSHKRSRWILLALLGAIVPLGLIGYAVSLTPQRSAENANHNDRGQTSRPASTQSAKEKIEPTPAPSKQEAESLALRAVSAGNDDPDALKTAGLVVSLRDLRTVDGENLMQRAVRSGAKRSLSALAAAGVSLTETYLGDAPLHRACKRGDAELIAEMLRLLKEYDQPIDTRNSGGNYPLHLVADLDNVQRLVPILHDAGCDLDARDLEGLTSLHLAAARLHANGTAALLKAGAKPNVRDRRGDTPLMRCVRAVTDASYEARAEAVVRTLLTNGADASLKSDDGQTAREIAQRRNLTVIAPLLAGTTSAPTTQP